MKAPAARKSASKTSTAEKSGTAKNTRSTEKGFRKFFEDSLKDIYWAEKALTKALPKMAKKATSHELRLAIEEHLSVTQNQVQSLEQVFGIIGVPAKAKKCDAMEGLIKEAQSIMKETDEGPVRDAGIIAASQKVEHYEIATYGTLCSFAKTLGETEAGDLLAQTLSEEKDCDVKFSEIAETSINEMAAHEINR